MSELRGRTSTDGAVVEMSEGTLRKLAKLEAELIGNAVKIHSHFLQINLREQPIPSAIKEKQLLRRIFQVSLQLAKSLN